MSLPNEDPGPSESTRASCRSASEHASFRFGVLALGGGLLLSSFLQFFVFMNGDETELGLMSPFRRHTTWAAGDAARVWLIVGLVSFLISLVVLEAVWRRWSKGKPAGSAGIVLTLLCCLSCCGFLGFVSPLFHTWMFRFF